MSSSLNPLRLRRPTREGFALTLIFELASLLSGVNTVAGSGMRSKRTSLLLVCRLRIRPCARCTSSRISRRSPSENCRSASRSAVFRSAVVSGCSSCAVFVASSIIFAVPSAALGRGRTAAVAVTIAFSAVFRVTFIPYRRDAFFVSREFWRYFVGRFDESCFAFSMRTAAVVSM
jgi:hypothetical protein